MSTDKPDDKIEKTIILAAPVARVWRAITDHEEFGAWFRLALDGPFRVGQRSRGKVLTPGYEHITWEVTVLEMVEPSRFAFSGQPGGNEDDMNSVIEPETTVTFTLESLNQAGQEATKLTICESGFASLPPGQRRDDALEGNRAGWEIQAQNLAQYVAQNRDQN